MITLNQAELESILKEVENDLGTVLKSEGARLAKAKDDGTDGPPADDGAPEASGGPPAGDSATPGGEASASAPPDAPPAGGPPADGSAPPDGSADPAAGAPMDVNALKAEYSQLPPEELKMHYVACKAAIMESMQGGGADAGAPPPAAPPAGPSASASPSAPPGPPMMGKGEIKANPTNGGRMAKSEDLVKAEGQIADLSAQVEGLTKAMKIALSTPQRKAVTSVAFLGKTEGDNKPAEQKLTKSEIQEKLLTKAADSKLSKSDRTLINQFCVGEVDVKKIAHLLG